MHEVKKHQCLTLVSLHKLDRFQLYIKSARPFVKDRSKIDALSGFLFYLLCSTYYWATIFLYKKCEKYKL